MDTKIEQRALDDKPSPGTPLSAPRWGTFDEFVAWFMTQPDDRVFNEATLPEDNRVCGCVIAQWLKSINGHEIVYDDNRGAKFRGVVGPWSITKDAAFGQFARMADRNPTKTKRELLDLGIISQYNS